MDELRDHLRLARLLLHCWPKLVDARELIGPPKCSLHDADFAPGLARPDAFQHVPQDRDEKLGARREVPVDRVLRDSQVASNPDHRQRLKAALEQALLAHVENLGDLLVAIELWARARHSLDRVPRFQYCAALG